MVLGKEMMRKQHLEYVLEDEVVTVTNIVAVSDFYFVVPLFKGGGALLVELRLPDDPALVLGDRHALPVRHLPGLGHQDLVALGLHHLAAHLLRLGLQPGPDLSIVGFDDTLSSAFQNPRLTTVRQPLRRMGETASRLLLDQLAGKLDEPASTTFEPELVVRASTAPRGGAR